MSLDALTPEQQASATALANRWRVRIERSRYRRRVLRRRLALVTFDVPIGVMAFLFSGCWMVFFRAAHGALPPRAPPPPSVRS